MYLDEEVQLAEQAVNVLAGLLDAASQRCWTPARCPAAVHLGHRGRVTAW